MTIPPDDTSTKWPHLPPRPWRYIGDTREVYQACPGAPLQPGTSCDHCGTGIIETHHFQSKTTGARFKVGSTCVLKMIEEMRTKSLTAAETAIRKARSAAAKKRTASKAAGLAELLDDPSVRAKIENLPSPRGFGTMLTWATWMLGHAGAAGKIRAATTIREALVTVKAPAKFTIRYGRVCKS